MRKLTELASKRFVLGSITILFSSLIWMVGISSADLNMELPFFEDITSRELGFNQQLPPKFEFIKPEISRSPLSLVGSSGPRSGINSFKEKQINESAKVTENIVMEGAIAHVDVQDLQAFNAKKERNLVYDDWQNGSPTGKEIVNSMDITINANGKMDTIDDVWPFGNSTGKMAIAEDRSTLVHSGWPPEGLKPSGFANYMNIEVRDISVKATNTVPGGSAIATSTIIIKPVQQIFCPPEAEVKLK